MDIRRINFEQLLSAAILGLALAIRLFQLGLIPLTDPEAELALQALSTVNSLPASEYGPENFSYSNIDQPLYVLLTGLLFFLTDSSDFLARLLPALAGSMLVLVPLLLRQKIGRIPAMIAALGIAIDPALVVVSRQINGPVLGLALLSIGIAAFISKRVLLAGFSFALALLTGPSLIPGLIALAVAGFLHRLFTRFSDPQDSIGTSYAPKEIKLAILVGGITLVAIGTLFLKVPAGLSPVFTSLPVYIQGWLEPSTIESGRILFALLVYLPLPLVFSLVTLFRMIAKKFDNDRLYIFICAIVLLVGSLLYPARQIHDIAWISLLLWLLSAGELVQILPRKPIQPIAVIQAGLILILIFLLWFSLTALARNPQNPDEVKIRSIVMIGVLALCALSTLVVAIGWSWGFARQGLSWSIVTALILYSISIMWGGSQLRLNQPQELLTIPPGHGQARLLEQTLNDLSVWNIGMPRLVQVQSRVDSPSLDWLFRKYPKYEEGEIGESRLAALIITRATDPTPASISTYRGQDFTWWNYPAWDGVLPPNLPAWLVFRSVPVNQDKIILWVREDLFPGSLQDIPITEP